MALRIPGDYKGFNPSFKWNRGESLDTLLIHLPGFKEEQLDWQIDRAGNLWISGGGERLLDGEWGLRFWKKFQVPDNCSINDVRFKFENETLHVSFPKLVVINPPPKEPKTPAVATVGANKETIVESKMNDDGKKASNGGAKLGGGGEVDALVKRQDERRDLLFNVAVAGLVLLVLGIYVTYKLSTARTR